MGKSSSRRSSRSTSRERQGSKKRSHKYKSKTKKKKKKEKCPDYDSSSSSDSNMSSSSNDSIRLLKKLQKERLKKAENIKRLKELAKINETPEEKRLRRLKKKEAKERKRKERMGWDSDYLHYTNTDNPFGDANLLDTFVWKKKLDRDGLTGVSSEEIEKRNREKQEENKRELEKVKKRRQERELERHQREEEVALMQRNKEAAQFQEWERQEDQFHLEQARLRSKIRIQDGRAKPIDLLAKYISAEEEVDAVEMHEPYTYLNGLTTKDLEDLIEDIKVYKELEKGKNLDYWNDITVIVQDELNKLRKLEKQSDYEVAVGRREGIHQSVASDVASVFKGKTAAQLKALQEQIESKINCKTDGIDIGYWESLLSQLKAHMARARLRDRHQDNLRRKLEMLKAEQGVAGVTGGLDSEDLDPCKSIKEENESESDEEEDDKHSEDSRKNEQEIANDMLSECFEDYESGGYSPKYLNPSQLEPGTFVTTEEDDVQRLEFARNQVLGTGQRVEVSKFFKFNFKFLKHFICLFALATPNV